MNEQDKREKRARLGVVVLSVALFGLSLSQDAFVFDDFDGQKVLSSLDVLLMGAFAFLGGGLLEQLIWDANVLFVIGLFMFYRGKPSAWKWSLAATVLSASFLGWDEVLAAENGRTGKITSLEYGYWLWLAGMLSLTIGALWSKLSKRA
jgi:hypothetical protein